MKSLGIYKVDFTDVSKYYNAGIWSMDKNILRFMLKKHMAYLAVCSGPLPVRDQPLGAPAFVTRICLLKPAHQIPACMVIQLIVGSAKYSLLWICFYFLSKIKRLYSCV